MNSRSLPIQELREPLLSALGRQRRLILTASTNPSAGNKRKHVPALNTLRTLRFEAPRVAALANASFA
jgi:hypothetical protein